MTDSTEVSELRRQMAATRGALRQDVRTTVAEVRRMVDWRPVAKKYAWVGLLGAGAVGYWLVPRRTVVVTAPEMFRGSTPDTRSGWGTSIAKASGQLLGRALVGYVTARMNERFQTQRSDTELRASQTRP